MLVWKCTWRFLQKINLFSYETNLNYNLLLKSEIFSISFSLSVKNSFETAAALKDILKFYLLYRDLGFMWLSFQKVVGYGCACFWNFGRNTAGAVSVLTLCKKIRWFKIFNWCTWKTLFVIKGLLVHQTDFLQIKMWMTWFRWLWTSFKFVLIVLVHAKSA